MQISRISEAEFARIVAGIAQDRDSIIRHNPIGTAEEILLWMLMSSLVIYLSLDPSETPCFPGRSDAQAYRDAIRFILNGRMKTEFEIDPYLEKLCGAE